MLCAFGWNKRSDSFFLHIILKELHETVFTLLSKKVTSNMILILIRKDFQSLSCGFPEYGFLFDPLKGVKTRNLK